MEIILIPAESRANVRIAANQVPGLKMGERSGTYLNGAYRLIRSEGTGIIRLSINFRQEYLGSLALVFNSQREIISVSFNPSSGDATHKLPAVLRIFLEKVREIARQDKAVRRPFSQPPPHWHNPGQGGNIRNSSQLGRIA